MLFFPAPIALWVNHLQDILLPPASTRSWRWVISFATIPCWSRSSGCICMVLNSVALPSSVCVGMCGAAKRIASLVELCSIFHFLIFIVTSLLFCCWSWLRLYSKWSTSDGQFIVELYSPLVMTVLRVYECPASLGSEKTLSEALVFMRCLRGTRYIMSVAYLMLQLRALASANQ